MHLFGTLIGGELHELSYRTDSGDVTPTSVKEFSGTEQLGRAVSLDEATRLCTERHEQEQDALRDN